MPHIYIFDTGAVETEIYQIKIMWVEGLSVFRGKFDKDTIMEYP